MNLRFYVWVFLVFAFLPVEKVNAEPDGVVSGDIRWFAIDNEREFHVRDTEDSLDGCSAWSELSKPEVERELVRSGGTIDPEGGTAAEVVLSVEGFYVNDATCAYILRTEVWVDSALIYMRSNPGRSNRSVVIFYEAPIWSTASVLHSAWPSDWGDMDERIAREHVSHIKSFLVALSEHSKEVRESILEHVDLEWRDFWLEKLSQ